jgi:hypothetical protein
MHDRIGAGIKPGARKGELRAPATMQPTRASLWLRRDDAPSARAHVISRHPATDSVPGPERPRVNQL